MRIKGQDWILSNQYLILNLHDPYWSAWQRFGWLEGTEGYSISRDALNKAQELNKKILVKTKYANYEITWRKASRYIHCEFIARDNTILICIPRDAFTKSDNRDMDEKPTSMNNILMGFSQEQRDKLRAKLGLTKR